MNAAPQTDPVRRQLLELILQSGPDGLLITDLYDLLFDRRVSTIHRAIARSQIVYGERHK